MLGDTGLEVAANEIGLRTLLSDERYDISVAYREARTAAEGLSPAELGERIADRLTDWSAKLAPALTEVLNAEPFDVVVASIFFATAAASACRARGRRLAIVRSSFYQGPGSSRPLEKVEGIILGGTELPLLLRDESWNGLRFLDAVRIHAEAAVARMLT